MGSAKLHRELKLELSANDIMYSAFFGVEKLIELSGAELVDRDGLSINQDVRAKYVGSIARILLRLSEKYGVNAVRGAVEHDDFKQYFGGNWR
ncbi:hypothetical protein HY484_01020 [Candidatus Woesearchaeota archaeon]|nr:hypothetical protein [Candidatus Woesearchaeota archaeon]